MLSDAGHTGRKLSGLKSPVNVLRDLAEDAALATVDASVVVSAAVETVATAVVGVRSLDHVSSPSEESSRGSKDDDDDDDDDNDD